MMDEITSDVIFGINIILAVVLTTWLFGINGLIGCALLGVSIVLPRIIWMFTSPLFIKSD